MIRKLLYICVTVAFTFIYAEARPPFGGTIFVNRNIITAEDPSAFVSITPTGREKRRLPDRRPRKGGAVNAYMFDAKFDDGQTMIVQVNPEFDEKEARKQAEKYLLVVGQMPFALRKDVARVTINAAKKPFGGGGRGLLIHTGMGESYIRAGILAETLYHEASHTSLDGPHAHNKDWLAAQKKDPEFISGYAKGHPRREDVAETYLLYFAYRYKPGRIPDKLKETIKKTVPNRIAYFDSLKLNMHPVVETKESTAKAKAPVTPDDLKKKIGKVAFKDAPLSEIFRQLRDDSKTNISVHWLYLKGAGVDMKKTISLSLAGATLGKVLAGVLEKAAPGKLGFEIRNGALVISSREVIDAEKKARDAKKKQQKKK
ncbi:MAG: hypothetical protein QGH60_08775 [Phycisphaerae bacterium]|jgi:hypothetical protein|nr:hypothetical protein [Phycisphaerae bacterium]